ncbi:hypothetical protein J4E91_009865 [Alternaria rosae]|nr:hypothetical protein J4E91_009865 [Alternaria rosae]
MHVQPTDMSVNNVPTSPLLKLPGELRNRIYGFAQEPDDIHLVHKLTRQYEYAGQPKRQFFGLTQACRQLRTEYLPIYKAQTRVQIQCLDSLPYINTFVLPTGTEPKQARGNLTVQLPDHGYEPKGELGTKGDLAPHRDIIYLVFLCSKAPQVNVAFRLADIPPLQPRMERVLYNLIHSEAVPELHTFVQNSVKHVECMFVKEKNAPLVIFWIKKGHAKEWMHQCSFGRWNRPGDDSRQQMDEWMLEMRLNTPVNQVDIGFIVDDELRERLADEWRRGRPVRNFRV